MRPFELDIDPANVDPDGLADNNDSSGTSLTLDGALTSGGSFTSADGLAHRLSILDTATVDQSGATFTITGTDADGYAQTEAVTGPGSGSTVTSTKYFLTVTSVAIASGAGSGTVDMGTVDEVATKTIPLNYRSDTALNVIANVTGTIDYSIEVTNSDVQLETRSDQNSFFWIDDSNWSGKTADLSASLASPGFRAMRVVSNSYTNTAELQIYATQPGS